MDDTIFVCEQCGKIAVSVCYEDTDVYNCPFCKFLMTKTRFTTAHCKDISLIGNKQADDLRYIIDREYVKFSPNFDVYKYNQRIEQSMPKFMFF